MSHNIFIMDLKRTDLKMDGFNFLFRIWHIFFSNDNYGKMRVNLSSLQLSFNLLKSCVARVC